MAALARYLQHGFAERCPTGWRCRAEVPLVDKAASQRLGFDPRADLLLEEIGGSRRVWVELEVSRADPVANHAKFTTARFFEDLPRQDTFVSMVSRHVDAGRAALAAGTASWMRAIGIPAFQVPMLPEHDGPAVKHLNALPLPELKRHGPPVGPEIERVLDITQAMALGDGHRVHKADNPWTVGLNVRRWNLEMAQPDMAALWGRRPVQYFAFDPTSGLFAPSKFCAFIPGAVFRGGAGVQLRALEPGLDVGAWASALASAAQAHAMTMRVYSHLGEDDPRFDGHVARKHLQGPLRYRLLGLEEAPTFIAHAFAAWHANHGSAVPLRGAVQLLIPPDADKVPRR